MLQGVINKTAQQSAWAHSPHGQAPHLPPHSLICTTLTCSCCYSGKCHISSSKGIRCADILRLPAAFLQPSTGQQAPSLVPLRTTSPCAPRAAPTAASQAHAPPLSRQAHPHGPQSTSSLMTPSAQTHLHPRRQERRRPEGAGCHKVSVDCYTACSTSKTGFATALAASAVQHVVVKQQ